MFAVKNGPWRPKMDPHGVWDRPHKYFHVFTEKCRISFGLNGNFFREICQPTSFFVGNFTVEKTQKLLSSMHPGFIVVHFQEWSLSIFANCSARKVKFHNNGRHFRFERIVYNSWKRTKWVKDFVAEFRTSCSLKTERKTFLSFKQRIYHFYKLTWSSNFNLNTEKNLVGWTKSFCWMRLVCVCTSKQKLLVDLTKYFVDVQFFGWID